MTIETTREYFKNMGFRNHCYNTGDGAETWSNLNDMFVHISPDGKTVELTAVDGLISSTTGKLGFPNDNLDLFISNLAKHCGDRIT